MEAQLIARQHFMPAPADKPGNLRDLLPVPGRWAEIIILWTQAEVSKALKGLVWSAGQFSKSEEDPDLPWEWKRDKAGSVNYLSGDFNPEEPGAPIAGMISSEGEGLVFYKLDGLTHLDIYASFSVASTDTIKVFLDIKDENMLLVARGEFSFSPVR